jgi:hypothetical protein
MPDRAEPTPASEVDRLERAIADQAARVLVLERVGDPGALFALAVLRALRADLAWWRQVTASRSRGAAFDSPGARSGASVRR